MAEQSDSERLYEMAGEVLPMQAFVTDVILLVGYKTPDGGHFITRMSTNPSGETLPAWTQLGMMEFSSEILRQMGRGPALEDAE